MIQLIGDSDNVLCIVTHQVLTLVCSNLLRTVLGVHFCGIPPFSFKDFR